MDNYNGSFWQLIAFLVLLIAKGLIIKRIFSSSSCAGISGKSQILYALVLTGKVLNTFEYYRNYWHFSQYLIFYSGIVLWILVIGINVLIYHYYKTSYEKHYDDFKIWRILVPTILLTLLAGTYDITWTFSIFLETIAIIPQIYFIKNARHVEKHVYIYMSLITIYKSLYVIEELNNQINHHYHYDVVNMITGSIQVMILVDFLVRLTIDKREEAYANDLDAPTHGNISIISENVNNSRFNNNLKDVILSPAMLNDEKDKKTEDPEIPIVHGEKKVTFDIPLKY